MNVSFIGLGIMGSRMAANLLKANFELNVFNRTKNKAQALLDQGATWANSPTHAAREADVLISMLSQPEAIEQMALGKDGFLQAMSKGSLWIDASTVHPNFSNSMMAEAKKRGIHFLDAPVAGSKAPAESGELVFLVGGNSETVHSAKPLFEAMGKKTIHVGEHGMGTSLKLVVNYMLATSMLAFAEGISLGKGLGLSEETLFNVLIGGPLVPPYLSLKRDNFEQGNYDPSFPLKWIHKDMHMISTSAYEVGVATPIAGLSKAFYQLALNAGLGDEDFSAIYKFVTEYNQSG